MSSEDTPSRRGIRNSARASIVSALRLLRTRRELLTLEAGEARANFRTIARFALAGVILFSTGYAFAAAIGVALAARAWFSGDLLPPLGIAAALHLFSGGVLLVATRARSKRAEPFSASIDQFDRDREWLSQIQSEFTKES